MHDKKFSLNVVIICSILSCISVGFNLFFNIKIEYIKKLFLFLNKEKDVLFSQKN